MIDIRQADVLIDMQTYPDCYFHTIFSDPPYQLGSSWYIDSNGQPMIKKSADFMNKWDAMDGHQWDEFFKQAYRILKYGGYCLLFAIDRQAWVLNYYAVKNGFDVCQSLAWYFMSGFPKGIDVGKQVDQRLGFKRDVVGINPNDRKKRNNLLSDYGLQGGVGKGFITVPASDIAKTFNGYKYGIAPLKPCLEHILVFRKPCKYGSVLNDIMSYHKNDEISPSVINIESCRVPLQDEQPPTGSAKRIFKNNKYTNESIYGNNKVTPDSGRFPSQLFVDEECARLLDRQSGTRPSGSSNGDAINGERGKITPLRRGLLIERNDSGGCSRILHTCKYESDEIELVRYCPKTSTTEREAGLNSSEYLQNHIELNKVKKVKNYHPTVKPISLTSHIALLFKLPTICKQRFYIPFAGVLSEAIGVYLSGIPSDNIIACEINPEYIKIGKARFEYWARKKQKQDMLNLFKIEEV